jgi:hypothetical protein
MSDIDPSTSASYKTNAQYTAVRLDTPADSSEDGPTLTGLADKKHLAYYFTGISNLADWSGIRGVVASAFQANTTSDQLSAGIGSPGTGSIKFADGPAGTETGWVHLLLRGSELFTETVDITPVSKGTAGWLQPGRIYVNHRSASPDTLANGKITSTHGLRLRVIPFEAADTDIYTATSTGKLPGLVSVAWQPAAGSDGCAVTLNAAGDVLWSAGGACEGWLWAWTRA